MDDGRIKESELIQLDGTIDKLIQNISELNTEYANAAASIRQAATGLVSSLRGVSGATRQGRQAIDESTKAAAKLAAAQENLSFALSETGKQVAWLKAQTADVNKATVEQQRQIQAAATSYNRLKSDIRELTTLFKSLTAAEREDAEFGGQIIAELKAKNTELKALDAAIKPVIQSMTELQKAEQKLAYYQSDEGQQLLQIRKQIRELTSERKSEKVELSETEKAEQRLAQARSNDAKTAAQRIEQLKIQQRENRLNAKEAEYAAESYYGLEARHNILVEQLKRMAPVTAEQRQEFDRLKSSVAGLKAQMRAFQEDVGNYTLGVGDYKSAFSGLDNSVQQIIRELPAAKINLDTFFLAISNNIPIFADMYAQEKRAFEGAKRNIRETAKSTAEATEQISKLNRPITKVVKSIFSWRTALTALVTVFTFWGKDIVNWVSTLFQGESALARLTRATKAVRKEMASTNADFGGSLVTVHKLAREWKALKSEAEKIQWIKDNESEWRKLDVAIYNVADAEKFFTSNTANIKKAFQDRARAAAAYALAEKGFEKQLKQMEELRELRAKGPAAFADNPGSSISTTGTAPGVNASSVQEQYETAIRYKEAEIQATQDEIDVYFDLADAAQVAGDAILGTYIDPDKAGRSGRGGLDLIEYIAREKLRVEKASNKAVTKAQTSEFAKRRAKATEEYAKEIGELEKIYNKNKRILSLDPDLKVKQGQLTPERQAELEAMQAKIKENLDKFKAMYNKTLSDIAADERIYTLRRESELIQIKLDTVKKGSAEEYTLRKQALQKQYELEIAQNRKLVESERQDEAAIKAKYDKLIEDIDTDKSVSTRRASISRIQLRLDGIKEEGQAELDLRIQLLNEQYELEKLENSKLAAELQQDEAVIKAKYDKLKEDAEYEHQMRMVEVLQEGIRLRLGVVQKGSQTELDLTLEQIEQERLAAIAANKNLAADLRQSEDAINAYYARQAAFAQGNFDLSSFRAAQATSKTAIVSGTASRKDRRKAGFEGSRRREVYEIDQQILDIQKQLNLAEQGKLDLTEEQLANLRLQKAELVKQKKELKGLNGFIQDIADGGLAGGILGALGFDDEAISAFNSAVDSVVSGISEIIEAEIAAAEQAVEAAEARVAAAQSAYDAEVEARNNGYANSVETARKELEQERKLQADKEAILKEAQQKQENINTITQTSSLITAAAGIWASLGTLGIAGPILAGTAIAAMFASFIAAKVKASQLASQQYGEGGLEFLEGGSHASGRDIDLSTTNSKGRRMRAEGGEAMAIINKKNTRKYRDILPSIVESLNKGTFEDKYLNAFNSFSIQDPSSSIVNIDLSRLETDVRKIREQHGTQMQVLPDGSLLTYYKNVRRVIRKN